APAALRRGSVVGRAAAFRKGSVVGRAAALRSGSVVGRAAALRSGSVVGRAAALRSGSVVGRAGTLRSGSVVGRAAPFRSGSVVGRDPAAAFATADAPRADRSMVVPGPESGPAAPGFLTCKTLLHDIQPTRTPRSVTCSSAIRNFDWQGGRWETIVVLALAGCLAVNAPPTG